MSKSRSRGTRRPLYIILALSLLISISYVAFRSYFTPAPLDIMAIDPSAITYGDTNISGVLQKDTAEVNIGNYILVLSDMRTVLLSEVAGLDHLLGRTVSASGFLFETIAPDPALPPLSMTVETLVVSE